MTALVFMQLLCLSIVDAYKQQTTRLWTNSSLFPDLFDQGQCPKSCGWFVVTIVGVRCSAMGLFPLRFMQATNIYTGRAATLSRKNSGENNVFHMQRGHCPYSKTGTSTGIIQKGSCILSLPLFLFILCCSIVTPRVKKALARRLARTWSTLLAARQSEL
jgi:hypothetical protein